jgi:hypothetical protein
MKTRIILLLIVSICLVTFSSAFATNQNWRLAIRDRGVVENQYSGRGNWHRIWQSRMLNDGDKLRTHENSRARVQLPDNSVITIGENSEVEMSEFRMNDQSRVVKVKLFVGRVRSRVGHFFGKESQFEVETPNGVLAARGTDFLVQHSGTGGGGTGQTTLLVYSSAVDITAAGQTMTIPAGNTAVIGPAGAVFMNPAGLTVQQTPVEAPAADVDLFQGPSDSSSSSSTSSSSSSSTTTTSSSSTSSSVPADPISNTTTTGVASSPGTATTDSTSTTGTTTEVGGTTTDASGTVQPPQITTGEVIIEIVPQK